VFNSLTTVVVSCFCDLEIMDTIIVINFFVLNVLEHLV